MKAHRWTSLQMVSIYCSTLPIVIHEYKTKLIASQIKLTASEEEQKELLRVLEQTKRMPMLEINRSQCWK